MNQTKASQRKVGYVTATRNQDGTYRGVIVACERGKRLYSFKIHGKFATRGSALDQARTNANRMLYSLVGEVDWNGLSAYKVVSARNCATVSRLHSERLEELRTELRAERLSYDELMELQSLARFIDPGDVELLEAAGVPE